MQRFNEYVPIFEKLNLIKKAINESLWIAHADIFFKNHLQESNIISVFHKKRIFKIHEKNIISRYFFFCDQVINELFKNSAFTNSSCTRHPNDMRERQEIKQLCKYIACKDLRI